jgi:hypothetical protein
MKHGLRRVFGIVAVGRTRVVSYYYHDGFLSAVVQIGSVADEATALATLDALRRLPPERFAHVARRARRGL